MSEEGISERGRELAVRAVKEADDKVLEDLRQRLSTRIDEIGRLEAEAAELRETVRKKQDVIDEGHRERIALENRHAELREDLRAVEGMLKGATDGWAEAKVGNAELRERVGELEEALQEARQPLQDIVDECGAEGSWPEVEAIEKIDAALSQRNAQAKLENQED